MGAKALSCLTSEVQQPLVADAGLALSRRARGPTTREHVLEIGARAHSFFLDEETGVFAGPLASAMLSVGSRAKRCVTPDFTDAVQPEVVQLQLASDELDPEPESAVASHELEHDSDNQVRCFLLTPTAKYETEGDEKRSHDVCATRKQGTACVDEAQRQREGVDLEELPGQHCPVGARSLAGGQASNGKNVEQRTRVKSSGSQRKFWVWSSSSNSSCLAFLAASGRSLTKRYRKQAVVDSTVYVPTQEADPRRDAEIKCLPSRPCAGDEFYVRYYVGHKSASGHEFLEFEFRSDGRLRYANNSSFKKEFMVRKECFVSPAVLAELKKTIEASKIFKEDDSQWPAPDSAGRQELEIVHAKEHISFMTSKIGSPADVRASCDPNGLLVFYYLVQDLKVLVFSLVRLHFRVKPV